MFFTEIVCLANSRKLSGRCIAGKEYLGDNTFGNWIRPVSAKPKGELSAVAITFAQGGWPELLDIISVPLLKASPQSYQSENFLVARNHAWERKRKLDKKCLDKMVDDVSTLWSMGQSSYNGWNDRVSEEQAKRQIHSSLLLIKPSRMVISVQDEINGKKVRAKFDHNGNEYWLAITDAMESKYLNRPSGEYKINKEVFLCISLGEPYREWCYKLVAGVIM